MSNLVLIYGGTRLDWTHPKDFERFNSWNSAKAHSKKKLLVEVSTYYSPSSILLR